jgi:hypothetical protein
MVVQVAGDFSARPTVLTKALRQLPGLELTFRQSIARDFLLLCAVFSALRPGPGPAAHADARD